MAPSCVERWSFERAPRSAARSACTVSTRAIRRGGARVRHLAASFHTASGSRAMCRPKETSMSRDRSPVTFTWARPCASTRAVRSRDASGRARSSTLGTLRALRQNVWRRLRRRLQARRCPNLIPSTWRCPASAACRRVDVDPGLGSHCLVSRETPSWPAWTACSISCAHAATERVGCVWHRDARATSSST